MSKLNKKDFTKKLMATVEAIEDDSILVPKARELNKALSNMIGFKKSEMEYNKYRNLNKRIDIFE